MTTTEQQQEMVRLYTEEHLTYRQIGKRFGVSHTWIGQQIRGAGISREQGTWVEYACDHCGERVRKVRSQARGRQWHFCRAECYWAFLEAKGRYNPWRQGQRIARAVVAKYVELQEDWVVHHWDGDNRNNAVQNLGVFASQADHMRHHRGGKVDPVWDGRLRAVQENRENAGTSEETPPSPPC